MCAQKGKVLIYGKNQLSVFVRTKVGFKNIFKYLKWFLKLSENFYL